MNEEDNSELLDLSHHHQAEFCRTRPAYRQGRKLTAVKAYTVNSESTHLLIFGVPKVNLRQELKSTLQKCGKIKSLTATAGYPTEEFTECFHVNFDRLHTARYAKKIMDMRSFYGGILHVCYAPELETLEETREKLYQRKLYIKKQLMKINRMRNTTEVKEVQSVSKMKFPYKSAPENTNKSILNNGYVPNINSIPNASMEGSKSMDKSQNHTINIEDDDQIGASSSNKRSHEGEIFKKRKKKKSSPRNIQLETDIKNSSGNVIVLNKIENPKIVNVCRKELNKIKININSKLI